MFNVNAGTTSHQDQSPKTTTPTLKRTQSTGNAALNQRQDSFSPAETKKSRLTGEQVNAQARYPSTHNTALSSSQLSAAANSSAHITPRMFVHYIPLRAQTASETDAQHMANTIHELAGKMVNFRGSNALSGATDIAFQGHGDHSENTLSYLVSQDVSWSNNQTKDGHNVVDHDEGHRKLVLTPNDLLKAMKDDGFVPNEFSGTIRSYSCQGPVFLKNFMEQAWPMGKQDVVGIANEWNMIMHPNTSAREIMAVMIKGGEEVTIVYPGEDFRIEIPNTRESFLASTAWAGRYDDAQGEYVFRPSAFSEVRFTFSGDTLQEEKIGTELLAATNMRSIAATRPRA